MYKLMMLPLLGILTAGTAMAQTSAPVTQPAATQTQAQNGAGHLDRLAAKLGLDAQGEATLKATFQRYGQQMKPVRQDMKQTAQALKAELAGNKDATIISSLTTQLSADRAKMQSIRAAKMSELQNELTPAQYAQLIVSHHEGRRFHKRSNG